MIFYPALQSMLAMANGSGGSQGITSMIMMMVIIFGIFYFLVIRPQRQQQSEREEMIENLEKGDRIITVGGIHGQISSLSEDTFKLNIAKDLKITVQRDKVAAVKNQDGDSPD
ncbi:MAG: preprotein translocase subunit YajC [bacterium]